MSRASRDKPETIRITLLAMADDDQRRLEISLRLKAGRWLAGSSRVSSKSRTGKLQATALSKEELAGRISPEHRITANKLTEIEEMKTFVTPGQIAAIGEALGVDLWSLPLLPAATETAAAELLARASLEAAQARRQSPEEPNRTRPARDRHKRAREGDAG